MRRLLSQGYFLSRRGGAVASRVAAAVVGVACAAEEREREREQVASRGLCDGDGGRVRAREKITSRFLI